MGGSPQKMGNERSRGERGKPSPKKKKVRGREVVGNEGPRKGMDIML